MQHHRFWIIRTPRFYQLLFDIIFLALSFAVYYLFRFKSGWFISVNDIYNSSLWSEETWIIASVLVFALGIFWIVVFWFSGLYANWYIRSPFDEYFTITRVTFIGCCCLAILILLDDINMVQQNSRFIILLYWIDVSLCIILGRLFARLLQESLRRHKVISFPVLLMGSVGKVQELLVTITKHSTFGYQPVGVVLDDKNDITRWEQSANSSLPVVGTFDSVGDLLERYRPEELLLSTEKPDHEELLRITMLADNFSIPVKIVPDLYEIFSGQAHTTQIYGMPLIEVRQQLMKPWEEVVKRLMDISISACALLFGFPIWLLVAIIVRLESRGPALYKQERVGKGGKPFMIYKFRSMRTDAEKSGPRWAIQNDPRVTRFGRFIRKTHLDEVPQFWNILKGDMSLVGPRPERPVFVEKFTREIPYFPRRHKVRPGLTGWYQVHFEVQDQTMEYVHKRLTMDFFYIENMSFRLDIEILVRTVVRILKGSGTA